MTEPSSGGKIFNQPPTTQELFDHIVNHAATQRCRAVTPTGDCSYRETPGLQCFVGALISDEAYHEELEGLVAGEDEVRDAVVESIGRGITEAEAYILTRCQEIHDDEAVDSWAHHLHTLAQRYGLQYNGPDVIEPVAKRTGP